MQTEVTKKVVSHVISNIWEKNLLSLQERVKILLQSVEVDAITLYRYHASLCQLDRAACIAMGWLSEMD